MVSVLFYYYIYQNVGKFPAVSVNFGLHTLDLNKIVQPELKIYKQASYVYSYIQILTFLLWRE